MKGDNFMKLKQFVQLLLIALFVWGVQSSTIHFQHHEIDKISQCDLCDTFEQIDLHHQNSSTVIVNENQAVRTTKQVEKIIVKSRFDYTNVPQIKRVKLVENRHYTVEPTPLGFNATAPPKNS
jgi:hypothetical protein